MAVSTKINHVKTVGLAVAVAGAFGASSALADVRATSVVELTGLTFSSGGEVLNYNTDLSTLNFTNSADYDVKLSGFTSLAQEVTGTTSSIDFPSGCLGDCPVIAENSFPLITGPMTGGNFAYADQLEEGSPIANQPNFDPLAGAHVANASIAGLASEGTGSVNSNNGLTANWTFVTCFDGPLQIDFDISMYTDVLVTPDEVFPSFAQASAFVTFQINDVTGGGSTPVLTLNITADSSRNAPTGADNSPEQCGPYQIFGSVGFTFIDLACGTGLSGPQSFSGLANVTAGRTYNLTARIETSVDVSKVPEPGILALFGAGLGLLGLQRRRKLKLR